MLIRSQDKKYLVNINVAQGLATGNKVVGSSFFVSAVFGNAGKEKVYLGVYQTEQRAIEVLDEIGKAYENSCIIEAHIPGDTPYMMVNATVFQMPAE